MPDTKITRIAYGDATVEVEQPQDYDCPLLLRIVGGNGWTWLDDNARIALATVLLPPGYTVQEEAR